MDRIHLIEQQIERLDDQAFATFLTWFDRYAELRWAARRTSDHADDCAAESKPQRVVHGIVHRSTYMACEPQVAAWCAQALRRE